MIIVVAALTIVVLLPSPLSCLVCSEVMERCFERSTNSASPSAMSAAANMAQRHRYRIHSASQSMLETTSPREPETAPSTTSVA